MNPIDLNPEQLAAVTVTGPNTLVVSGPGSGKTKVLVARVAELLRRGASAESIVVIAYTNASADEIQFRLDVKVAFCGTLHGYCLRLLERHGALIGLTSKIMVMDEEQAEAAFDEHAAALGYKGTKESLRAARATFLGGMVLPEERKQGSDLVVSSWFARMIGTGAFDFDGILFWGLALMRRRDAALSPVHLLVDEAQDMAAIDARIYLSLPCSSRFYVGDPDQNIFSWRGADPSQLTALAHNPGWLTLKLQGNYRCGLEICELANNLIRHNANRVEKLTLPALGVVGPGDVETWSNLPTAAHEQRALAEDIRLVEEPEHCAVLMRTNALVEEYAKALESYGIPVARRKERERPKDWRLCKAALAALANPENDAIVLWLVEAKDGAARAKEVRLKAAASRKSVNEAFGGLPATLEQTPGQALDWLNRLGISAESVSTARDALARSQTIADALLLLAQEERASVTVGTGVTVCTMHAAKGREWSTVYLPAFEQSIIPGARRSLDIEEERRLAFVAITRAKRRLVVSWANERKQNKWQPAAPAERSQFVAEMEKP